MTRIVTDSTANLSSDLLQQHNITVVPLRLQMGGKDYRDGEITQDEFFRRLPTTNPLPTTSQPTPLDFEEVYDQILAQGEDILSLHLSSDLSGTHNSARIAATNKGLDRISVVDSRTISGGLALAILAAAELLKAGKSRTDVAAEVERLAKDIQLFLTLDTLEYLKRGGRIGGAAALVGGLLRIKPTIVIKDGRLEAGERARSRRKALELLVEKQVTAFGNRPVWVAIAEGAATDTEEFEGLLRAGLNVQKLIRCQLGPVIGTHTGPNTLGCAAMPAL